MATIRYLTATKQTVEYRAWANMLQRCENQNRCDFGHYGARNIHVCARWHNFEQFLHDMGPKPPGHFSIHRIDNDGDYTPDNCKWATTAEQASNRRTRAALEEQMPFVPERDEVWCTSPQIDLSGIDADHPLGGYCAYPTDAFNHWG